MATSINTTFFDSPTKCVTCTTYAFMPPRNDVCRISPQLLILRCNMPYQDSIPHECGKPTQNCHFFPCNKPIISPKKSFLMQIKHNKYNYYTLKLDLKFGYSKLHLPTLVFELVLCGYIDLHILDWSQYVQYHGGGVMNMVRVCN